MLHISKEQIDSVEMEIRGRRAIKQQAAFSFRFRPGRQSRDRLAVTCCPQEFHCPQDQLSGLWICSDPQVGRMSSHQQSHVPAQRGRGATIQGQQAAWSPGTSEGHNGNCHTHLPRPLRAPAPLTTHTCTLWVFRHTYKQMETSKQDEYLTSKYF